MSTSTRILVGSAIERLRDLPDESVHCCITSPPYWGMRTYEQQPGMIGLEPTFAEHLVNLMEVFREVRRVLRSDGTLWVVYGDGYSHGGNGSRDPDLWPKQSRNDHRVEHSKRTSEFKPKDAMLMPHRLAIAMQEDGWWVRSPIVWCLSGGVWLYARTSKGVGVHMLSDLTRLDPSTVELWNGSRWTRVQAWVPSPQRGSPLELVLRSGERIGCTADHLWPTQRGLIPAGDLVVGDVLESCRLPDTETPAPSWLTPDALWLAGLYLAEGSRSGDTVQISGHVNETERWERLQRIAEHYGAIAHLYRPGGNRANVNLHRTHAINAIIHTVVGGRVAKDKHLQPIVWSWDNKALAQIMQGYLDGDGSFRGNGRWRLGFTRNHSWERDLRCLAARLGAALTLKLSTAKIDDKTYKAFRGEWCWHRTGHHNERDRSEVMEIRNSRGRSFWDVTVEDEPHLFALASGVLTHNSKPNAMPESTVDRPANAYEMIYMFSKSEHYFYDHVAVLQPPQSGPSDLKKMDEQLDRIGGKHLESADMMQKASALTTIGRKRSVGSSAGVNLRNVWTIATEPFPGPHFAVMPKKLVERCLLAASSAHGVCATCGAPWHRKTRKRATGRRRQRVVAGLGQSHSRESHGLSAIAGEFQEGVQIDTVGWKPGCDHRSAIIPATALDPFAGAGTVGLVADRLGRSSVLIEISPTYAEMMRGRILDDNPLFAAVEVA